MALLISMILVASTLAVAEPRFGLDRDPVCVASALAEGDLRVLLPGDPAQAPCAWTGAAAFALELGRCHTLYSWWNGVRLELGRTGKGELMARVSGPTELVKTRYRYKLEEVVPSDRVCFKKVPEVKDVVEYFGRPGITLERLVSKRSVFSKKWRRTKLRKDQYQPSPWEIEVTEFPGGRKRLQGASKRQIAKLLKGTKYKIEDAMYKDLDDKDSKWLRPDYVSGKHLRSFQRFSVPAAVADSR